MKSAHKAPVRRFNAMEALECMGCKEPLARDALSCPKCGMPVEPEPGKKVGPSVSLIGALFVVVGPFLPWLTDPVMSANGIDATRKAALIFLGLGAFAAMFSLSAMTGKKFTGLRGNISVGIVGAALSTYLYLRLGDLLPENEMGAYFGAKELGDVLDKGIYFCMVGSGLILFGGILTRSAKEKNAL